MGSKALVMNLKTHQSGAYLCRYSRSCVSDSGLWYPDSGHIILGLPGETHDTMVAHAEILSDLPLATLKIHQLQLIRVRECA